VWGGTGGFPARNSEIQVASANSAGLQQERQEETEMGRDEGTKPAMPPATRSRTSRSASPRASLQARGG
ncbi:MAG TPA: hypothetical protein VFP74_14950, partial [Pseudolabrys sp.]|nr:hypothetical protein [Pseudolabrys sp.]